MTAAGAVVAYIDEPQIDLEGLSRATSRFSEKLVRTMGRDTSGVKGMKRRRQRHRALRRHRLTGA